MTIKIEATRHELEKIEELAKKVDTVLDGGDYPSWRDVMYEVQEMLAEAELCEVEPLIKDERTRKIVEDWAKLNEVVSVFVTAIKDSGGTYLYWELTRAECGQSTSICFSGELPDPLDELKTYTIDELCGDEEEE